MAIRDIFTRRRSENSVNHVQTWGAVNFFSQFTSSKKYSDMYLWLIVSRIFRGLQNIRYELSPEVNGRARMSLESLLRFFNTNLQTLVWQLWQNGFVVIEKNNLGNWYAVPYDDIRLDGYGAVQDYRNVVYSEAYMYMRKSDIQVVRENLNAINDYKNADIYLTKTFGAFGILSGTDLGINAADKEELQRNLKSHAGTTEAKDQFVISSSPLNFHQIDFKIKDLALDDKVKQEIMALAGYFGVPYDLIPMSGKSTYDNQRQAIIDFYRNCVTPLAEVVLSLGRYVIRHDKAYTLIPTEALTFTIDNVAELADDRTADVDYKTKVADLALKMKELGITVPDYITQELQEQ